MFAIFQKPSSIDDLHVATDWHCHVLPGVDDGVRHLEHSAAILNRMRERGIRRVVHTPHINPEMFPSNTEEFLKARFGEYVEQLPDSCKDGMQLDLAAEYMVADGFENRDPDELLQIEPGHVLVEMSYLFPSPNMEQALFHLSQKGLVPVIAHPERYLYLDGKLSTFERYHDMGAVFQLNLLSLSGVYGKSSLHILDYLLDKGWYAYCGTDTHSPDYFHRIENIKFKTGYKDKLLSSMSNTNKL